MLTDSAVETVLQSRDEIQSANQRAIDIKNAEKIALATTTWAIAGR